MPDRKEIEDILKKTGFRCMMCGECRTETTSDSNLILLSASETNDIIKATGMKREEIVDPYPESFDIGDCKVTFAWCLKRKDKKCIFLKNDNRCSIYKNRPWICRTYPFMLTDDELIISECVNKGLIISDDEVAIQADSVIDRKEKEEMEYIDINKIYGKTDLTGIKSCVIDSEGVKKIE